MVSANTQIHDFPLLAAGQAQKHVTINAVLEKLDALLHISVISAKLDSPPVAPAIGDRYIVGPSPAGSWTGRDTEIATYQSEGWSYLRPQDGWSVWDQQYQQLRVYSDGDWGSLEAPPKLGWGRNLITNGGFDVWQRGTVFNGLQNGTWLADRWRISAGGGALNSATIHKVSISPGIAVSPGFQSALSLRAVSSGDGTGWLSLTQTIENVSALAGQPFSLALDCRCSAPFNLLAQIIQLTPGYTGQVWSGTMSVGADWARSEIVGELPALVDETEFAGAYILALALPTSGLFAFDVTGVQLEQADKSTTPEIRPPAVETQLCRRYFRRYAAQRSIADLSYVMRTTPIESGVGPYDYDAEL